MASDLRECMSWVAFVRAARPLRLWGFVGILVRRPGFWSSPFAGPAGEDGLAVGWFCGSAEFPAAQMAWSVEGRVHATEDRGPNPVCAVPSSCRRAFPDASQEPAGLYPDALIPLQWSAR